MKKEMIQDVLKVFTVGATALLLAAGAGGFGYMSVILFCQIPRISGYLAVGAFFVAMISVAATLGVVYTCGAWIVRKGKFGKGKFER